MDTVVMMMLWVLIVVFAKKKDPLVFLERMTTLRRVRYDEE
jgi:hypothetical protein